MRVLHRYITLYYANKKAAEAASINHNFFIIIVIKMKNLPLADVSVKRLLSMI